MVNPLREKLLDWQRYRSRLERELRFLVVDGDAEIRQQLEDMLYRARFASRSVASAEEALDFVEREHYSIVITGELLPRMRGLALTRQLRVAHPDIDVILSSWEPSVPLAVAALDLRLLDVLPKPFDDPPQVAERIAGCGRRNLDRRMRTYVLNELRNLVEHLDPEARLRTTAALERRLASYKSSLGSFDRVLVVERDRDLRLLSEHLLLGGLQVETVETLAVAAKRLSDRDICLAFLDADLDDRGVSELLKTLRDADPLVDLGLVAHTPDTSAAITAMREGVGCYVPWPPPSMDRVVMRARDVLRCGRRDRLVDNLFLELYRETTRALGTDDGTEAEDFSAFRQLIGLERVLEGGDEGGEDVLEREEAARQLHQVLSEILTDFEERSLPKADDSLPDAVGPERRQHARVPESQFVRFRKVSATASTLAYLGDVSEGGLFIRTPNLASRGSTVEVDFNLVYQSRAYLVCCRARVAWVARDEQASSMAPGFGVELLNPPEDVRELLRQVVAERAANSGS